MVVRMGSREARQKFSEMLGRVHYGGDTVILESSGKPMAAVVPLRDYERMMKERDAKFEVFDRIRRAVPDYPEEEVEADIAAAIAEVRGKRVERRP